MTSSTLTAFTAQLPQRSLQLLGQLATRLDSIVASKPRGMITLADLTRSVSRGMPFLTAIEAEAITTVAVQLSENAQMIKPQINMQRENTIFTSVSNVLKLRHDTAKNSIGNVR